MFRELAKFTGLDVNRVMFSWVSAAEGAKWADLVNTTTKQIIELGPYKHYRELTAKSKEVANG